MKRDYRTWWRNWNNNGEMLPDLEPLVPELRETFGSWQNIFLLMGLADADCAIEQLWAEREGLADAPGPRGRRE